MNKTPSHYELVVKADMLRGRGLDHPEVKRIIGSLDFLRKLDSDKRILEIGCGDGDSIGEISELTKARRFGVDLADFRKNKNFYFLQGEAENLPFSDNTFDFIYSVYCLPYVQDKLKVLNEVRRILKLGGEARIDVSELIEPPLEEITQVINSPHLLSYPYSAGDLKHTVAVIKKQDNSPFQFPNLKSLDGLTMKYSYYK